jgi:hypothetical protein
MLCKLSYLRRKAFEIHGIVSSYVIMRRVEKSNSAKKEEVRSRMAEKKLVYQIMMEKAKI